jgi:hypothetical protein
MSFRDLKQNRQKTLEKIAEQYSKFSSKGGETAVDDRFWYPAVDKVGNGTATIRFLPSPDGEDSPTVRLYKRSFEGPTGKWYINNCLSTVGKDDPVNDYNNKLLEEAGLTWKEAEISNPKLIEGIRTRKRKEIYISNVLILKDPANPENEGKVKLFNYGPQIRSLIDEVMNPTFEGEQRINPFDLFGDAALKIKIVKKDGKWRNYEKSEWIKAPIDDEKELERIYNSEYPLQPFLAADQFKTYDELQTQLNRVLGLSSTKKTAELPVDNVPVKGKQTVAPWEHEEGEVDEVDALFESLKED